MEPQKTEKADLVNTKVIFSQIGLILILALVYMGFEWKAGQQRGKSVRVWFDLPVKFTLQG